MTHTSYSCAHGHLLVPLIDGPPTCKLSLYDGRALPRQNPRSTSGLRPISSEALHARPQTTAWGHQSSPCPRRRRDLSNASQCA
eukprot:94370-Chlamydomonas_euryale.AAC.3